MRSSRIRTLASCAALAWVAIACGPAERERVLSQSDATTRWNVLVLVPDTVRPDRLSLYGHERPTSPVLEALGREGTRFDLAITVAPRTWQSFTSILTGLYPTRHGVRHIYDDPLRPEVPTLGTLFGDAGYATALFGPGTFIRQLTQGRDFDAYVRPTPAELRAGQRPVDGLVANHLMEWIAERKGPFLAFVRFVGGHWPYEANSAWVERFARCEDHDHAFNRGTYGVAPSRDGPRLRDADAFRRLIWTVPEEDVLEHMKLHYDAELAAVDALVGRILAGLRAHGLLERTIVAVTSDHGESFGEHGYLQHGPRVDGAVMRVPLLLRFPADHPLARPGTVVEGVVRVVDLLPTLLEATGQAPQADLDGVSLAPRIRGEKGPPLVAYGESGRSFMGIDPERRIRGVAGKHRMLRTRDWKLVFVPAPEGGTYRLYDLRADRAERENVAGRYPDVVADLRAELDAVRARELDPGPERALTAGELERLRALGYVQ